MTEAARTKSNRISRKNRLKLPEKTRQRLYPVVLELFSSNDFHQVKMRTISKKSGVSVSNVYKYFSSKEDLLFTVLEDKIKVIHGLIEIHVQGLQSGKEIFRKILWATMDYYDRNPEVAITAFITVPTRTWMEQDSFPDKGLRYLFSKQVEKLNASNQIDPVVDVRLFQDIYYMICHRYIITWYYFGRRWNLVDAVDRDFDILWKMLEKRVCQLTAETCPFIVHLSKQQGESVTGPVSDDVLQPDEVRTGGDKSD